MSVTFGGPQRATFDVHGSTLSDVASALSQMPEAGTTEWSPTYALASDGTSAATVKVPMKITMPRWVEYGAASQADKAEWDRFYAALEVHEQGHVAIVRQQMAGVDQQLAGLSASAAQQTWTTALQQLQTASDTYDTTTNHGINQGTTINVSSAPDAGTNSTGTTTDSAPVDAGSGANINATDDSAAPTDSATPMDNSVSSAQTTDPQGDPGNTPDPPASSDASAATDPPDATDPSGS